MPKGTNPWLVAKRLADGENFCVVCDQTTIKPDGRPLPGVILCDLCDCETHLACAGVDAVPAGDFSCVVCACGP